MKNIGMILVFLMASLSGEDLIINLEENDLVYIEKNFDLRNDSEENGIPLLFVKSKVGFDSKLICHELKINQDKKEGKYTIEFEIGHPVDKKGKKGVFVSTSSSIKPYLYELDEIKDIETPEEFLEVKKEKNIMVYTRFLAKGNSKVFAIKLYVFKSISQLKLLLKTPEKHQERLNHLIKVNKIED